MNWKSLCYPGKRQQTGLWVEMRCKLAVGSREILYRCFSRQGGWSYFEGNRWGLCFRKNKTLFRPDLSTKTYMWESRRVEQCCFLSVHRPGKSSAIAIVFLRAKYAGAAVFQMLFWTPDISFIINLGLVNHGTKKIYFLVDKWNPSWVDLIPIFRKSQLKIGGFYQKSEFVT